MANITKTQIRKRTKELYDRIQKLIDGELSDIKCELESLKDEVEEESSNIEPYEGFNDLTPEQEERQEWLESATSSLDDAFNCLDETEDNLTSSQNSLEEID